MAAEILGIVLAKSRQFGYHCNDDGWFSVRREVSAGDAASVSSSMVVEDGSSSVASQEDASEIWLNPDLTPFSATMELDNHDSLHAVESFVRGMADAVLELEIPPGELDISDDETLAERMHQPSKGHKKLLCTGARRALPYSTVLEKGTRTDDINPAQHEVPDATSGTANYAQQIIFVSDGGSGACLSPSLSPSLREILNGSQIDPTELKLARVRNAQHTSCPSLWTGSTKDTESVAGYDVWLRPDFSDRTAQGVSLISGTRPEVKALLVSEAENGNHSAPVSSEKASKGGMESMENPKSPLRPLSSSLEGASRSVPVDLFATIYSAGFLSMSNPGTLKWLAFEGHNRDDDFNTSPRRPPRPISSADSTDESCEATDDSFDPEDYEGDYWSDYTPDVSYMSDVHPFMQHKGAVLTSLFHRFGCWPVPTTLASDGRDAPDINTSPPTHREKLSQSRNKRARGSNRKDDSSSGSSEQGPESTNSKKPRYGGRQRRPRLACPYYKKAPMRYYDCHGKIISSISHLKQHLSRNHQLPVYCPVCKDVFSHEAERDVHAEQQSCNLRTNVVHEGLTRDQKEQLKRRASPTTTEEQQWFEIFDILFPGYNPRPSSAYVNAELVAETENYQDFERVEGPGIILDTLLRRGVSLVRADNPEHDLGVFRENLLAEALAFIARRWHESRLAVAHDRTDHPANSSDSWASGIGATPSTAGGTLVEPLNEAATPEDHIILDRKIVEEDGGGIEGLRPLEPGDMPAATMLSPSDIFGGQDPDGGTPGMDQYDDTALFQSSINWPDENA